MIKKYIILLLLIVIISFFLLKSQETFTSPAETEILNIQLAENQEKFKKFQEFQKKIIEENEFKIGYSETPNTNLKTLGVCPLGQYYEGEVPETITGRDIQNCSPCTPCNPGYYLKEGCAGNTNSVCEAEKVPHKIFLDAHNKNPNLHKVINPHKHPYFHETNPQGIQTFLESSTIHHHI